MTRGLSWGERPEDHDAHRRAWDALEHTLGAVEQEYRVGLVALREMQLRQTGRTWTHYQEQHEAWVNRNLVKKEGTP